MTAHVAWLHVAPIKALAVQERQSIQLGPNGVEDDRRYCIVDPEGLMLNAKRVQAFVSVRPTLDEAAGHLELAMPDGQSVSGTIELGAAALVTIYGRQAPAREVVGPWSDALSQLAARPVKLLRFDAIGEGVDRADEGGGATLLGVESLRAMAQAAGTTDPVDPRRFRMLIGVAGTPAHDEDDWIGRPVRAGEAVIVPMGNVGRCAVTTLHPETGVSDLNTLKALARYRGEVDTTEPLPFGVWARVAIPGKVSVGDEVSV